jgi:hypothetical protein
MQGMGGTDMLFSKQVNEQQRMNGIRNKMNETTYRLTTHKATQGQSTTKIRKT